MSKTKKALVASVLAGGAMFAGLSTANAAVIIPAPNADDLVVGVAPGVTYISYTSGDAVLQSGIGTVVFVDGQYLVLDSAGNRVF